MVLLALCTTGLLALAGLALDGGRAYAERREMQNAADSAAMAGTRALDQIITGKTTAAGTIDTAAKDAAEKNGAERSTVTCQLVRFDRSIIGACPAAGVLDAAVKAQAAGVAITLSNTEDTFFMKVVGSSTFTAAADATAQIGQPGGSFAAPFLVCATAPGHIPQILVPDATTTSGFKVNNAAIGATYDIFGNDIKNDGKDCGNPSASFRGNACIEGQGKPCDAASYSIPGPWDADTGNENGPTVRLVNGGTACATDYTVGCVLVLPLCKGGNGVPGNGYRMICIDMGLFQVTKVENHDIDAKFLGAAPLNQGGITGPADPNGARVVALTD
jgi:Flp pilus assembly protein TadG